MPEATKMDPIVSKDTDAARKVREHPQYIDNLDFLTDDEKEKLKERMAYEFSIVGLNKVLAKLEKDAYGEKEKKERYAPKDLEVIQILRKVVQETQKSALFTSEAIIKLQEEKDKMASKSGKVIIDAFRELVVKKGWGNAQELTKELDAIVDSYIQAKKPSVQRAQVHVEPIDLTKFEEAVEKALGENKQIKEGAFSNWLGKLWGWVRSVFTKRLRTTAQINRETQELLRKMNHSNWAYETKMHIRESLKIRGM